jgi:hypothetical protein
MHAHTAADLQRLIPRLARHEHKVHQIIIKSRELMASLAREAVAELTLIKGVCLCLCLCVCVCVCIDSNLRKASKEERQKEDANKRTPQPSLTCSLLLPHALARCLVLAAFVISLSFSLFLCFSLSLSLSLFSPSLHPALSFCFLCLSPGLPPAGAVGF